MHQTFFFIFITICLIYAEWMMKNDKNDKKENLKNWTPISLICSDYKILTKKFYQID